MITRSRRATLNSSPSSSSSTSITSNQNNGSNNNNNIVSVGSMRPARGSSRTSSSPIPVSSLTPKSPTPLSTITTQSVPERTVEDTVKDVVDGIVDLVTRISSTETSTNRRNTTTIALPSTTIYGKSVASMNSPVTRQSHYATRQHQSVNYNETDDSDVEVLEDENNPNHVESITCEVSFDVNISEDDGAQCSVCGLFDRLNFDALVNGKVEKVCSKRCADKSRVGIKTLRCASCNKEISSNCQGYLPNFGNEKSVLCSEQCLLKFEKANEPSSRCYHCKIELHKKEGDPTIYYWQTMEFCSPECIEKLQQFWGKKCANCSANVPQQSLGKYSVRFGNVIKQFCYGACLEQYKKVFKVCSYCQIDLSGCPLTCSTVAGGTNVKRIREFCDPICRSHYLQMVALRNSTSNSGNSSDYAFSSSTCPCCQCHRLVDKSSCLEVIYKCGKYRICGTFCLSAFKFSFNVTKIICESCFKYGWSTRQVTILHYSGLTKLFCSRKCLQMYVLKIRRIQPCLTCNVKKYNFDLVEKYDPTSGDSKLFCSTYCYSMFARNEFQNRGKEPKAICDWCKKLARLQYHIPSPEKTVRNFCTYSCVLAYQQYYNDLVTRQQDYYSTRPSPLSSSLTSSSSISSKSHATNSNNTNTSSFSSRQIASSSPMLAHFTRQLSNPINRDCLTSSDIVDPTGLSSFLTGPSPYNDLSRASSSRFSTANNSLLRNNDVETVSSPHNSSSSPSQDNSNSIVSYLLVSGNSTKSKSEQGEDRSKNLRNNEVNSTGIPSQYLTHSSRDERHENDLTVSKNSVDKSIMTQPQKRSKATSCRPVKRDRSTQTEEEDKEIANKSLLTKENNTRDESEKIRGFSADVIDKDSKFIPVPIFVPFFVPIPVPIPMGAASLFPLPMPTPIPFGIPINQTPLRSSMATPSTSSMSTQNQSQIEKQKLKSSFDSNMERRSLRRTTRVISYKDDDNRPKNNDLRKVKESSDEDVIMIDSSESESDSSKNSPKDFSMLSPTKLKNEKKQLNSITGNKTDFKQRNLTQKQISDCNQNNNSFSCERNKRRKSGQTTTSKSSIMTHDNETNLESSFNRSDTLLNKKSKLTTIPNLGESSSLPKRRLRDK